MRIAAWIFGYAFLATYLIGGSDAAKCTDAEMAATPIPSTCTNCVTTPKSPDCATPTPAPAPTNPTESPVTSPTIISSTPSDSSNAAVIAALNTALANARAENLRLRTAARRQQRLERLRNLQRRREVARRAAANRRRAAVFPNRRRRNRFG